MTPIKAILLFGAAVYVLDHAGFLSLKCVAVSEVEADWLVWSLARAHGVQHRKLDSVPVQRMSQEEMERMFG